MARRSGVAHPPALRPPPLPVDAACDDGVRGDVRGVRDVSARATLADYLSVVPESVRRRNAIDAVAIAGAAPGDAAAVAEARAARAKRSTQSRAAQRSGAGFEDGVFAALDALVVDGVLAWWGHYGPQTKHLGEGRIVVTGVAPCDVVGCTADGRALVCELKHDNARVVLDGRKTRDAHVAEHQRAQLTATARAGGVALLVVEVADVAAVIPWASLAQAKTVDIGTARTWHGYGGRLVEMLRGAIRARGV